MYQLSWDRINIKFKKKKRIKYDKTTIIAATKLIKEHKHQ